MITLRYTQPIRLTIEANDAQLATIYQILLALVVIAGAVLVVNRAAGKVEDFADDVWQAWRLVWQSLVKPFSLAWPIATG